MKKYIVGGAVRDFLLAKLQGKLNTQSEIVNYWSKVEKDWVVVGSTPEQMVNLGFRPVGKSFPVFLDPDTHEEYALARTEKKTGHGYTGFECYASSDVTLVDDLKRRDLTINAMAAEIPENITFETVIDPYGGLEDLKRKVFRHVSPAFAEDPVRILRVARLATRFGDFTLDPSTQALMKKMVAAGEVDALVPERIWQEWHRSLKEKHPWRFFEILEYSCAQGKLFPEVKNLERKKEVLARAVLNEAEQEVILAIELYDLAITSLQALIKRYHIPNIYAEIALLVAEYFPQFTVLELKADKILDLYQQTDAFRRTNRFDLLLKTYTWLTLDEVNQERLALLNPLLSELKKIDLSHILKQGFTGQEIAEQLKKERINKIDAWLK